MVSSSTISFTDPPAFPPQTRPADTRTTFEKVGKWMFEDKDDSSSKFTAEAYAAASTRLGRNTRSLQSIPSSRISVVCLLPFAFLCMVVSSPIFEEMFDNSTALTEMTTETVLQDVASLVALSFGSKTKS
ncbi:hypothetical protein SNK03_010503 [Fusarium graminearum]